MPTFRKRRFKPSSFAITTLPLTTQVLMQIKALGLPEPVKEYKFLADRKYRFDYAWPDRKLSIEVHGAVFANGYHVRGKGFEIDREKINEAQLAGWRVLELTEHIITSGKSMGMIEQAYGK